MIAIVDYDVGNLQSVVNMFSRLGFVAQCTRDPDLIRNADRVVLPGNGSFDYCMRSLRNTGLVPVLEEFVDTGKSLLGICVGAQLLGRGSEEGTETGLGWLDMDVIRFPTVTGLRVPHMGWNHVRIAKATKLVTGFDESFRFYFVHSYFMSGVSPEDVLMMADYGQHFVAAVQHDNVAGVQFHPEKSHKFGMRLLRNFASA
jgi:glutamine amidotransferase